MNVTRVLLAARRQLVEDLGQSAAERLLLRRVLADSERVELGARALAVYQRTGLRWLAHRLHLLDILPGQLAAKDDLVPDLGLASARRALPVVASPGNVRVRVAYFLGCVTNVAYPSFPRPLGGGHAAQEPLQRADPPRSPVLRDAPSELWRRQRSRTAGGA